jgi:hypothetical protein
MCRAVDKGRAIHAAGNIKASGGPLEAEIRKMLSESLPSTSKVATGYFYGASSQCSNEVDVLVYEDHEAFRLDPGPSEQHYIPYTSVSILGQVKNSSSDLPGAIEQVQSSINAWLGMKQEMARAFGIQHGPAQFEPLTFIVCGEGKDADMNKLGKTLAGKGAPYVDYILFLDRAEIVAGNCNLLAMDDPFINFLEYRSKTALHLCRPDAGASEPIGVALLWLYFALVSKLGLDKGNNLRYHSFCRQIEHLHPLRPVQRLL